MTVIFNSIDGTISFALNETPLGTAFKNSAFKKGGFYPAIAGSIYQGDGSEIQLLTSWINFLKKN